VSKLGSSGIISIELHQWLYQMTILAVMYIQQSGVDVEIIAARKDGRGATV
jgi:hypothetical protein